MSARDELARDIFLADNVNAPAGLMEAEWDGNKGDETYAHVIADGLLAAGYRKPRTITTAEEANALIGESVVRSDAGIVYEKYPDEDGPEFDYWLIPGEQRAQAVTKIDLPATVLYEPEPQP